MYKANELINTSTNGQKKFLMGKWEIKHIMQMELQEYHQIKLLRSLKK